jgi:SAM-dependent methyltransferase
VARSLVGWALSGWSLGSGGPPLRALDPACGAGAFLLAVREQVPDAALLGLDVDPGAVSACRAALPGADVRLGDGLVAGPEGFDLVVGNPPFLGQLAKATARDRDARRRVEDRFGAVATGYVDTAALFLLAGLDAVRPGGRVVLIQPESVLGAAHAGPLRAAVEERASVLGLREVDPRAFAAAVDTCALLLERRSEGFVRGRIDVDSLPANRQRIAPRRFAVDSPSDGPTGIPREPPTWSPLLARARGVPEVRLDPSAGTLADLATATAGFRQHHYALAAHVVEHVDGLDRIATTGLVDPGHLAWGERPARIGGRTWQRPAVDLVGVAADDPRVASWFRARLQPKVLVAPQTRVVEAAVDADGAHLPATPLVAVEPRSDAGEHGRADDTVWLAAAALSAPPATAWALALTAGTARSRAALKLSARQVLTLPLPVDEQSWRAAAEALRTGASPADLAEDLTAAYGLDPDDPVVAWYRARLG